MILEPGDPTELQPDLVYRGVAAALLAATPLRNLDELGSAGAPAPLCHRSFRIDPGPIQPMSSRARPGDVVGLVEQVAIVIAHEIDPNARAVSLAVSAEDFRLALRALLTRVEISGIGQPTFRGCSARQVGHRLERVLLLDVQYFLSLPAAAGPE